MSELSKPITRIGELRKILDEYKDDDYIAFCETMKGGKYLAFFNIETEKRYTIGALDICFVPLTNKDPISYIREIEDVYERQDSRY